MLFNQNKQGQAIIVRMCVDNQTAAYLQEENEDGPFSILHQLTLFVCLAARKWVLLLEA